MTIKSAKRTIYAIGQIYQKLSIFILPVQTVKKIVVLLLLAVPVFASAQQSDVQSAPPDLAPPSMAPPAPLVPVRYLQRLGWDREEYAALYEVSVDAEESSGIWKNIISKQKTAQTDLDLQLEPGRYRFRVQSFNSEGRAGGISEWMLFDVRPIPKIERPPPSNESAPAPAAEVAEAAVKPKGKRHFSFGVAPELNANVLTGQAYSAEINVEVGMVADFVIGLRSGISYDFKNFMSVEPEFFIRWYALGSGRRVSLFIQADSGMSIIRRNNKITGVFLCGLSAGLRINLRSFYLEPYARGGWPFLWGAGLGVGWTTR